MTVYLYILDTMADWEIAFLTAELASGRFFRKGLAPVDIVRFGATLAPVTTMGGWKLAPDAEAGGVTIGDDDLLVLPGAETWMDPAQRGVLEYAKERLARGGKVAAICDATTGLAGAGALDDIPHTSNGRGYLSMMCPAYRGESFYVDEPAVTSGPLITASGLAPVEFTREVLAALDVFPAGGVEAWYNLYTRREARFLYELMGAAEGTAGA